jgi:hypothetical protein
VLKVDHHGSNTSSTPLFLNRFAPEIAVIQVGADNPYGHPTPETLDRLHRAGAKVFRTDEDGDIIVTIDQKEATGAVTKPHAGQASEYCTWLKSRGELEDDGENVNKSHEECDCENHSIEQLPAGPLPTFGICHRVKPELIPPPPPSGPR